MTLFLDNLFFIYFMLLSFKTFVFFYINLFLQVALSENPPKELGYIYMYQRID